MGILAVQVATPKVQVGLRSVGLRTVQAGIKDGYHSKNGYFTAIEWRKHLLACVHIVGQHFKQFYCRQLKNGQLNEM